MSLLLFSGAGQGVRTSALIIQLLTLLSESEPERERGCGETADCVVYQSFIKPHRRVTSDCGPVCRPGCLPSEKKPQHTSAENDKNSKLRFQTKVTDKNEHLESKVEGCHGNLTSFK